MLLVKIGIWWLRIELLRPVVRFYLPDGAKFTRNQAICFLSTASCIEFLILRGFFNK